MACSTRDMRSEWTGLCGAGLSSVGIGPTKPKPRESTKEIASKTASRKNDDLCVLLSSACRWMRRLWKVFHLFLRLRRVEDVGIEYGTQVALLELKMFAILFRETHTKHGPSESRYPMPNRRRQYEIPYLPSGTSQRVISTCCSSLINEQSSHTQYSNTRRSRLAFTHHAHSPRHYVVVFSHQSRSSRSLTGISHRFRRSHIVRHAY